MIVYVVFLGIQKTSLQNQKQSSKHVNGFWTIRIKIAKFVGNVVVIEETNIASLFYHKYLMESYNSPIKAPPVQYYDEIDKKGIDENFNNLVDYSAKNMQLLEDSYRQYCVVHEEVKDEGLAKKQMQVIQKMIKNHEAPYNDIFKKYSVTIIQG